MVRLQRRSVSSTGSSTAVDMRVKFQRSSELKKRSEFAGSWVWCMDREMLVDRDAATDRCVVLFSSSVPSPLILENLTSNYRPRLVASEWPGFTPPLPHELIP